MRIYIDILQTVNILILILMSTSKNTHLPYSYHCNPNRLHSYAQEIDKQNQELSSNMMRYENNSRGSSLEIPKKYDYLNKYNQHQIFEKEYERQVDEIRDNNFVRDILIVEKRSNSSSSRSPNYRRRSSPTDKRIESPKEILMRQYQRRSSPKQILMREYERKVSPCENSLRKSNKKNMHEIKVQQGRSITLMNSRSNSQTPKYNTSNYSSVLSAIPNLGQGLTAEVAHQNQILRGQVVEFRTLVTRLESQNQTKKESIDILREKIKASELLYHQHIDELESQLKKWKARYQILNKDLYEQEALQQQRKESYYFHENNKLGVEQFLQNIEQMMKGFKTNESKQKQKQSKYFKFTPNKSLDTRIDHIYEELRSQLHIKNTFQKFVFNIWEMYKKVEKVSQLRENEKELRGLWKWLKKLGTLQSCVKEIMPVLGQKMGINSSSEPIDFMETLALRLSEQLIMQNH